MAGLHTTAGSFALSDNKAPANAAVVENIIQNGGIVLGKTNMTQFANFTTQGMPNGYSSKGGSVKNAYDRDKDPSGSSTGSAVAVSAGFCAMAVEDRHLFLYCGLRRGKRGCGLQARIRQVAFQRDFANIKNILQGCPRLP